MNIIVSIIAVSFIISLFVLGNILCALGKQISDEWGNTPRG